MDILVILVKQDFNSCYTSTQLASSKVDQVPTIVLTQGVQEMQTVVFSGSPEQCVSNLGF